MTSFRSELHRLARELGVGVGPPLPTAECPRCSGSGEAYDADGPVQQAVIAHRMASILARHAGRTEPKLKLPDVPPGPCLTCRATGRVPAIDADVAARIAGDGPSRLEQLMTGVAQRLLPDRFPESPE